MDATHSAPIREAAAPNVPHPQPKSATILLLTSPNEFSAFSITKKKKHKHIVTHEKLLSCLFKGKGWGVISHIRYRAYEKQCEVQLGTVPALPARTHAGAIILFLFFSGEGEGG
jgi:hypothetical protein